MTPARMRLPNGVVIEGHIRQTPKAYHFDFIPYEQERDKNGDPIVGKNFYRSSVNNLGMPYVATKYYPGIPIIFEVDYPQDDRGGQMVTWARAYNQNNETEVCIWILGSQKTTKKTIGMHDEDIRKAPAAFIAAAAKSSAVKAIIGALAGIAAFFGSKK